MKAWRLTGVPDESPAAGVRLDEAAPEPPGPSGSQVIVRVRAAALNFRDVMIMRGDYAIPASPGTVPLCDGAGEVVAVGPGARRLTVGDKVTSTYFLGWIGGRLSRHFMADQFGASRDGLLAEYLICDERELVTAPDHLSWAEAATLPCSAVTAWSAVVGRHPVLPGQTVLTLGTGGVSLFAVQFAKLAGARVVAATSSEAKAQRLVDLGADAVINYREHPEWDARVLAVTDGEGAHRVVETVGPDTLERSVRSTAIGGEIAHVGGGGFAHGAGTSFDPTILHGRALTIRRVTVGSVEEFEEMNRAVSFHQLRPAIDKLFAFAEAAQAYGRMLDRGHVGKIVVTVD